MALRSHPTATNGAGLDGSREQADARGMGNIIRGAALAVAVIALAASGKSYQTFRPGQAASDKDTAELTSAAGQVMTEYGLSVDSAVDGLVTTEWAPISGTMETTLGEPHKAPQARWVTTIRGGTITVNVQCRAYTGESCGGAIPDGERLTKQAEEMAFAIKRAAEQ